MTKQFFSLVIAKSVQNIPRNRPKHTPKMVSRRRRLDVKNVFSAVSIGVIQKASLQTFMRKGLTALNKPAK